MRSLQFYLSILSSTAISTLVSPIASAATSKPSTFLLQASNSDSSINGAYVTLVQGRTDSGRYMNLTSSARTSATPFYLTSSRYLASTQLSSDWIATVALDASASRLFLTVPPTYPADWPSELERLVPVSCELVTTGVARTLRCGTQRFISGCLEGGTVALADASTLPECHSITMNVIAA